MKKLIGVSIILVICIVSGCSAQWEAIPDKSIEFAANATEMADQIEEALDEFEALSKQKTLNNDDQEIILKHIEKLTPVIRKFKENESLFIPKLVNKASVNKIKDIEHELLEIQEKAEKGKATVKDLKNLIIVMEDDVDFNLF